MKFLPPESETGAFINFLPEELPSPFLKKQVKIWLEEREYVIHDRDESLVFQVGLSFVAAFFYRIPLSMGPIDCFSLQAYALGRFGAQFLDDDDLSLINEKLKTAGGDGGVIGVDKYGNVAMPFNTSGMYRGFVKPGERKVLIYKKD